MQKMMGVTVAQTSGRNKNNDKITILESKLNDDNLSKKQKKNLKKKLKKQKEKENEMEKECTSRT
jgi:hypothetical protein